VADAYPVTTHNFEHLRGDTFQRVINVGMDLTGYTLVMQVRETEDASKVLASPEITVGVWDDAANKTQIVIELPGTASQKWPETCVYDIEARQGDYRRTLVRGSMNVIPDVTRL
jgi:hypothetical protein